MSRSNHRYNLYLLSLVLLISRRCAESFALNRHQKICLDRAQFKWGDDDVTTTSNHATSNRREFFDDVSAAVLTITLTQSSAIQPAIAYTPDSDPLRESLYLMSRVQEATVQQERFVNRATSQDALKSKMKLTLRLVEKNYRLLDQITFASEFVSPTDKIVDATTAGYEAAEALQNAIDYVKDDLKSGPFENGQKDYLTENLAECRERLFDFLSYMPKDKLEAARKRVEEGRCLYHEYGMLGVT